ncbi:hypothetical protein OG384_04335 [Streptomyces sp. NBC_01324]|uniref:hypothetical protein n=1 Tax=Streptomyces sp. NBC_01324 TaxID=2903826 RepID=UPI002E13ADF3|nr:hypothetical protein OG384_04335 [Streptomyces sp. NBC_01324]
MTTALHPDITLAKSRTLKDWCDTHPNRPCGVEELTDWTTVRLDNGVLLVSARITGPDPAVALREFSVRQEERLGHRVDPAVGDQPPSLDFSVPGRTACVWRLGGVWVEVWHPGTPAPAPAPLAQAVAITQEQEQEQAVVGRRVEFAYYWDQDTYLPGVITAITEDPASLRIRLDGTRSALACHPDYEGLRYLDQIAPVPDLPMGRFIPTPADFDGEYAGIPAVQLEEGETVLLTTDNGKARAALAAFAEDMQIDPDYADPEDLVTRTVVFKWQSEDAECPWLMAFADEGDDMAVQIHYLPAWGDAVTAPPAPLPPWEETPAEAAQADRYWFDRDYDTDDEE